MAKVLVTESYLSAIASAIRSKAGTTQTFTPAQMASAITNLPSGNTDAEDAFITRNFSQVSSYSNSRVITVGSYVFAEVSNLSKIDLPNATQLYPYAFASCKATELSAPLVRGVGSNAFAFATFSSLQFPSLVTITQQHAFASFQGSLISLPNLVSTASTSTDTGQKMTFAYCINLMSVYVPKLTIVNNYDFYGCDLLPSIDLPSVSIIRQSAFKGCQYLSVVSAPLLTNIGPDAFGSCGNLHYIPNESSVLSIGTSAFYRAGLLSINNLPSAVTLGTYAFGYCSSLTFVSLQKTGTLPSYIFAYCSQLQSVVLVNCSRINTCAFTRCFNLLSLTLLSTSMVTLAATVASIFASTPINGYTASARRVGSVFVPAALLSDYQNNMFWKTISSRIVALG